MFGRPYFMSPNVPAERLAAVRMAFDVTMKDPDYIAEATKAFGPFDPTSGVKMQDRLKDIYAMPTALIEGAKAAVAVTPN